ncbi:MAG: hypothetical protein HYR56_22205 [Acidobacteria bacterium]|nr:hypothetical protein [Acidobacteriota bacterium]MBI3423198.1 hypothetical protein [Acidobacteriota bacterium]
MKRSLTTIVVIIGVLHSALHLSLADERKAGHPLKLAGEVVEVKENMEFTDKDYLAFDVKLRLHFINISSKPIILLLGMYDKNEWWIGGNRVARSADELVARNFLLNDSYWPSNSSTSQKWIGLRSRLSQKVPPSELTRVIAPNKEFAQVAYTFLKFRRIASSNDFDKNQPWTVIKEISPLFLSVTLEIWPINLETTFPQHDYRLGKKLQKQWRDVGDLQLDYLASEPIKFELPTSKRTL